jgi:hypothetical protein
MPNLSRAPTACALRRTLTGLLLSAAMLGAAWPSQAAYNVWTSEYTVKQQELQTVIEAQFPRKLRYLQIIELNLSNPRLSLNPASNRLITTVDAQIDNKLLMSRPVTGTLSMSSSLRYDAATHAVRLDAPAVERIDIPGLPAQYASQLNEIGNTAARQVLNNYPIYTFQPDQLEMNGKHVEPGAITILDDGIKVEIKPL